jgi:antitoxin VapB
MGVVESKTFKSGNSIAVRLPRDMALPEGTAITIEKKGDALIIRPAKDPVEEKRKVAEFLAALKTLKERFPLTDREERDPDIFPDRPGLY